MVSTSMIAVRLAVVAAVCLAVILAQPPPSKVLQRGTFIVVNGKLVRKRLPDVLSETPTPTPTPNPTPTQTPQSGNQSAVAREGAATSVNPADVFGFLGTNSLLNTADEGLKLNVSQEEIANLTSQISDENTNNAIITGELNSIRIGQSASKAFSPGGANQSEPIGEFGPHLLTSKEAALIGRTADKFLAAGKQLKNDLNLNNNQLHILRAAPLPNIKSALDCPYDNPIVCNPTSKYRTFDGSCNNLANPVFGKANTPFERFLPAKYEDGFGAMRETGSGSGAPLPNPRFISTNFHQASQPHHKQFGVSVWTTTFGQFTSHDLNMNTISRGQNGGFLRCCNRDGTVTTDPLLLALDCRPIEIPAGDPFFAQFNRRCMNFVRALGGTDLKCSVAGREQINQVTHYLDLSTVYGNKETQAQSLRTFVDGLLKSGIAPDGRELLLQNPSATGTFSCPSAAGSNHHCFRAGDVRVNQNDNLITVHTLFLREHNRLARGLKQLNPSWGDEKLFQEARRIVTAEFQHIVYNEYARALVSEPVARFFNILPKTTGYFTGYSETVNPAIRNSFMAAAFRSGHSTIDDLMAPGFPLRGNFNNPTGIYTPGMDSFVASMIRSSQQTMDRFDAVTLTNHLFEGRPGTGGDLMATNIQRGRDHGLPSYNDFRQFCGLSRAFLFTTGFGGLVHHSLDSVLRLAAIYRHVDDIDAWTGMTSELPIRGGVFGPTASCLVSLQFNFLKRGDRYYYESDNEHTKFSPEQLNTIRTTTLSSLLCANTGQDIIPKNSFLNPFTSDQVVSCPSLPPIDLSHWAESQCVNGGWGSWFPWTRCSNGISFRFRLCNNPERSPCGKDCEGQRFMPRPCIFTGFFTDPRNLRNRPKPVRVGPSNSNTRVSPTPLPTVTPVNITDTAEILKAAIKAAPRGVFNSGK